MNMVNNLVIPPNLTPSTEIIAKANSFIATINPYEINNGSALVLYFDERSKAYYLVCHVDADTLVSHSDLQASLEANDEDEYYKLNRDITEDKAAFKAMKDDAINGRSFEDMVIEFDTSYRKDKPLKVYGGQHRISAITSAIEQNQKNASIHGIRVYLCLTRDQKVEIATVNNTSIAVPNDLLDRMREQLLGSELRDWCQNVGLLDKGGDFADRKSRDSPTVRVARTLLVNFYNGLNAKDDDFHEPIVCKSGDVDEVYLDIRKQIDWSDDRLIKMGKEFSRLHVSQRNSVSGREEDKNAEFARKAISLAVVSGWAYAAGFFQRNVEYLKCHYSLPDSVTGHSDPLNAKVLSQARIKGIDPDTYRGLGARISPGELGRMLEVFIVHATKATTKKITKDLANAAIQSYEAKKATFEANKVLGKI
jgi:hypothetical protein